MTIWVLNRPGVLLDNGSGRPVKAGRLALDILFCDIWSPERRWPQRAGDEPNHLPPGIATGSSRPLRLNALRRIRRAP